MSIKNPSYTSSSDVKSICDEYFSAKQLDISYFGFGTIIPDGRFYHLVSNPEWAKYHLIEKGLPPAGYTNYDEMTSGIKLPHLDSGASIGWSDQWMRLAKERFGIENLIMILIKQKECLQFYSFDLHDPRAYEIYINHFDIFENFIFYFKDKAQDLLVQSSKDPLYVPGKYLKPTSAQHQSLSQCAAGGTDLKNDFASPARYYLNIKGYELNITKREYQCLTHLSHGAKIKQIASVLDISVKTVETHLMSIKRKLKLNSMNEAIQVYWDNRMV